jgi:hypothetical protein
MPAEVMFVALGGMVTFLVMINMINKAEIEKARAKHAAESGNDDMKRLLQDNASEISRLRARVEVLERLATDGDRKLAGEIDRLRADQRVSP